MARARPIMWAVVSEFERAEVRRIAGGVVIDVRQPHAGVDRGVAGLEAKVERVAVIRPGALDW